MNWYPSLLTSSLNIESNSWFNIKQVQNKNFKNKRKHKKHKYTTYKTKTIILDLNEKQKSTINKWLLDCIEVYNITNKYIANYLNENKDFEIINFIKLREILNDKIRPVCKVNGLNKHTGDYQVKHCIEMYKSSLELHNYKIDKFKINDMSDNRRHYNLTIEPNSVSKNKNSVFYKSLGLIKSSLPLNLIKYNSILQYDKLKKTYKIIVPFKVECNKNLNQYRKCGIDIGVRTFLTTYSENETLEIGTNLINRVDNNNKRIDKIKRNEKNISNEKYDKLIMKYNEKLKNLRNDLHNKSAKFLLERYNEIVIGKVSIKSMISNLTGNLYKIVKRRLCFLSHYMFRMKLKQMASKYDVKVKEVNEYMTSKTCSKCSNIHKNLGQNKTYECASCGLSIDRDINASINIYRM